MTEIERVADLCERLEKRRQIESFDGYQCVEFEDEDAIDAATEIKRLAARCDALEEALGKAASRLNLLVEYYVSAGASVKWDMSAWVDEARAALGSDPA